MTLDFICGNDVECGLCLNTDNKHVCRCQ